MISAKTRVMTGCVCLALSALGCSAGRDVEVSGKVTAPSSLSVGNKLAIDFLDVVGEGTQTEKSIAHSTEREGLGDFDETVALEGDKVIVRAIDDRDGNGQCTAGEAWGQTEANIVDNRVEALTLTLGNAPCPTEL